MRYKRRRALGVVLICLAIAIAILQQRFALPGHETPATTTAQTTPTSSSSTPAPSLPTLPIPPGDEPAAPVPPQPAQALAIDTLAQLPIKGRAPKTDYRRIQFGNGWLLVGSCDTRNIILNRDLSQAVVSNSCKVTSGTLNDPYTGKEIIFARGPDSSALIQIDHVVALSNAWQTGAQLLTVQERIALANDPLELLAVDGNANQAKGDGDAATWLPANKAFRCQYVARQIAVKAKYKLWVTQAEHDAMQRVLESCPTQTVPSVK